MKQRTWLAVILLLYLLLGFIYAVTTPVFEASDELWHYPMVRHLADGNPLPVQVFDPALAGPWKQEASQPPLYYYLAAGLTFWIDTSDMGAVRLENPHVDNGIITEDGNINLVVHDPAWSPWQGTLLAVRIVRIFSVLLGAGTVFLTYLIAGEVEPQRPEIHLGAAAAVAFLPMFLFISGSVNNDNLAILLASLAILLLIRIVTKAGPDGSQNQVRLFVLPWLLVGIVIGLAVLTKEGTFGLFPIAAGAAFISQWQQEPYRQQPGKMGRGLLWAAGKGLLALLVLMVPVLLIAGWWYWRNIQLYGDFLGWNAFIAVLGQRAHPASLWQLWSERQGFLMSYWGLFGGVNVAMPAWIYLLLNFLLGLAIIGFVIYLLQLLRDWCRRLDKWEWKLPALVTIMFDFVVRYFALIVCLLFSMAVIVGLIQWATTTWSSQGRLVFSALGPLSVLFILGLVGWLPQRPSRSLTSGLAAGLFLIALLAPFLWIRPTYQPPRFDAPLADADTIFGETIELVGYEIDAQSLLPGQSIWVTLEWEVLQPIAENWTIFVHLTDPILGRPIAQRDMYPGQGLRPTSFLETGERVVTRHRLKVPETALAPAELLLTSGFYDFNSCPTCTRLPVTKSEMLPTEQDAVALATLPLQAVPGEVPNPISVRFENGFELAGFELAPRQVQAGADFDLTLHWQLNEPTEEDYTIFAQVVAEDTTRWASIDLAVPTSQWPLAEPQPVSLPMTIAAGAPPDVYPLIIGLYTLSAAGEFQRLQMISEDGRPTDDFLELTLIRVDE